MRLLLVKESICHRLASQIEADNAWPAVVNLCERWRVMPALCSRLDACGYTPRKEVADLIRQIAAQEFVRTAQRIRGGAAALATLETHGIEAAAFKGMAALTWLHRGKLDRTIQDVDLLVRPNELFRAVAALRASGFLPKFGDVTLKEYVSFVRHTPVLAGNEAITLVSRDGTEIDLHWKIGAFDAERLLASAQSVPLLGTTARVVAPAEGLQLTAHHALRNNLVPDDIARDILDAQRWFRLLGANIRQAPLGRDSSAIDDAIEALRLVLARLVGDDCATVAPQSAAARRLAALYERQLAEGAINTDLTYVFSLHVVQQTLGYVWRYKHRYRATLSAIYRVDGKPALSLLDRLTRLAAAFFQTSPTQWRQLRNLALARDKII